MDSRASNIFRFRRFTQYAQAAGAAAVVVGTLVLLGWLLDVSLLKSVLPSKVAMKPITAVCFVLTGASLLLLGIAPSAPRVASATRKRAAFVCSGLVAGIGLATLCEYLFGVNLGIDDLLFRSSLRAANDPGRMAVTTAVSFVLLGGALLAVDEGHRLGRLCSELSALVALLLGMGAMIGYLYGVEWLYHLLPFTPMALHTAFLFAMLGLGVLFSRPERGLTAIITSERGGGVMARRILPVAVLLPIALGWLQLKAEHAGLYGDRFGLALLVTSSITLLGFWVWVAARSLNVSDARREQALERLRGRTQELTAMTQQLWQASKLATMGELAASIAHELNNPLATISLRAESLAEQLAADDSRRLAVDVIAREVERMANLVSNLLLFSRRSQPQISTVDLCEELTNSLDFIHYHLRSRRINVVKEFATGLPTVQADRQQLRQVFLNLLTNASDAMPEGGTLTVRVRSGLLAHGGEAVVVEFSDTGIGIEAQFLPKLFESFFTTKPEGKGTGLGLPICRRTVEQHRGAIVVESEVGNGTTVRITLPITETGVPTQSE